MRERRKDMLKDKEKKKREIIILKNEEKIELWGWEYRNSDWKKDRQEVQIEKKERMKGEEMKKKRQYTKKRRKD